jgi:integrase
LLAARDAHRVPLSKRCLQILETAKSLSPQSDLVFPSMKGVALSDMTFTKLLRDEKLAATAHGFR